MTNKEEKEHKQLLDWFDSLPECVPDPNAPKRTSTAPMLTGQAARDAEADYNNFKHGYGLGSHTKR